MNIAIIGNGNVGGTLGARWAQLGHDIVYGTRDPNGERTQAALAASGPRARAASPAEAAAFGEVVLIAMPYNALTQALPTLGDLAGKIVLDAVNNVDAAPGAPAIAVEIAAMLPGARVVKAFNTMGSNVMANPEFGGERASNYICGDDAAAKETAAELARALGFEVVDTGPLAGAVLLEGLARLWIDMAYRRGFGREIAFRLLRR
jgi:predicted dinucleotide-binding enzyme